MEDLTPHPNPNPGPRMTMDTQQIKKPAEENVTSETEEVTEEK